MNWIYFSNDFQNKLLSYAHIYGDTWYTMWKTPVSDYSIDDIDKEAMRILKIRNECVDRSARMAGLYIFQIMAEILNMRNEYNKHNPCATRRQ